MEGSWNEVGMQIVYRDQNIVKKSDHVISRDQILQDERNKIRQANYDNWEEYTMPDEVYQDRLAAIAKAAAMDCLKIPNHIHGGFKLLPPSSIIEIRIIPLTFIEEEPEPEALPEPPEPEQQQVELGNNVTQEPVEMPSQS